MTVAAASVEAARWATAEAKQRGWSLFLLNGQIILTAPVASLSPSLVDRLIEFSAAAAILLVDGGAR